MLIEVHKVFPEAADEIAFKVGKFILCRTACRKRLFDKAEDGDERGEVVAGPQMEMQSRKTLRIDSLKRLLCSDDGYGDALEHRKEILKTIKHAVRRFRAAIVYEVILYATVG